MEAEFKEGQKVEVSSETEGFEGAWFVATVAGTPTKKTKKKYTVEYQSLLDETETKPLREYKDLSQIRPLQPEEISPPRFEPNEEVDVLFNDGWWKGVVTKVLEGSRYSVYFKTTNEELDYQQSELRLHLEWIHGKWVQELPQNQDIDTEVDTCTESNTIKEKMEHTTTKRNTESSRHCKKLKRGNAATSSSFLSVHPEKAVTTNTGPSEKLSSYPVLTFLQRKKGSALDGNRSERPDQQQCRTSSEAGLCCQVRASPGEKQRRTKRSKEQYCLVTSDNDMSRNSSSEEKDRHIGYQDCEAINKEDNEIVTQALVVDHNCDEVKMENDSLPLVVYREKTMPTTPSLLDSPTDHAAPSFHQDKIVQSPPLSIKIPGDRLCHEMVSPDTNNQQKRKRAEEETYLVPCGSNETRNTTSENLVPSDHQHFSIESDYDHSDDDCGDGNHGVINMVQGYDYEPMDMNVHISALKSVVCVIDEGDLPCVDGDGLSTTHDTLDSMGLIPNSEDKEVDEFEKSDVTEVVSAHHGVGNSIIDMKNEQVGQVVIPGNFVQLYKDLVSRYGEIVPPKMSKVKKRACEVTLLELLDVVSSILATLPVEITSEKINSWEEIAEDCASIGLRMDWFMERMSEYRNWLVKCSSENLEDLEMEITETDVVLVEKRREIKILDEKLVALKARLAKAREDRCSIAALL